MFDVTISGPPSLHSPTRAAWTSSAAHALRTRPGVGPVLAVALRAEIGTIDRFARGAALAAYAGIVSRVRASAGHVRTGAITREESPWLRWALVEVAMRAIKRSDARGRWARRLALRKGIKIARVALARRMCAEIVQTWRTVG